jgi:DNA-binding MarR family transcriptional regulator
MAYFARAERAHQRNANELLRRFGLKHTEWRMLALAAEVGEVSVTELADKVVIERTTIGKAIGRLVEKGWLTKVACVDDARSVKVQLTVTGKKLVEDTSPLIFDLMRQYQRVFSEADYTNFFQAVQLYERQVRELTEVNQSGLD